MHFDSIPGLIDASRRDAAHRTGHGEKKRGGKGKREGREGWERESRGRGEGRLVYEWPSGILRVSFG